MKDSFPRERSNSQVVHYKESLQSSFISTRYQDWLLGATADLLLLPRFPIYSVTCQYGVSNFHVHTSVLESVLSKQK